MSKSNNVSTPKYDDLQIQAVITAAASGVFDNFRKSLEPLGTPIDWKQIRYQEGKTLFHLATTSPEILDSLRQISLSEQELGVFSEVDNIGRTPLSYAAIKGNDECLLFLIEKGANPNEYDRPARSTAPATPLQRAVLSHNKNTVKILLPKEEGAGRGFSVEVVKAMKTALYLAFKEGDVDIISLLINHIPTGEIQNFLSLRIPIETQPGKTLLQFVFETTYSKTIVELIESMPEGKRLAFLQARVTYKDYPFGRSLLRFVFEKADPQTIVKLIKLIPKEDTLNFLSTIVSNEKPVLHWAAENGDLQIMSALISALQLEKKPLEQNPLDATNKFGLRPLDFAVKNKNLDIFFALIGAGASLNVVNALKETSLHHAINSLEEGAVLVLAKELQKKKLLKAALEEPHGIKALLYAVQHNKPEIITFLIEEGGVDINAADDRGMTPLHNAALCGNEEAASILLKKLKEKGENFLKEALEAKDNHGNTPLKYAINKNKEVANQLIAAGREVSVNDQMQNEALELAVKQNQRTLISNLAGPQADLNAVDRYGNGNTLLHKAIDAGYESVSTLLKKLRENGGGALKKALETNNGNKQTPLELAIQQGVARTIVLLLDAETEVDEDQRTPFHKACRAGNMIAFTELMKIIPLRFLTAADKTGQTPFHLAAKYERQGIISALCNLKIPGFSLSEAINKQNNNGLTSFHFAVYYGDEASISLLIEKGAYLNAVDKFGQTPLHSATLNENPKAVSVLLKKLEEKGGNFLEEALNAQDLLGMTPLHQACKRGNLDAISELIKHASPKLLQINDNSRKRPIDCLPADSKFDEIRSTMKNLENKAMPSNDPLLQTMRGSAKGSVLTTNTNLSH